MTDADKASLRQNRDALVEALRKAGCDHVRGNVARCPWHDDRHPSGSIFRSPEGVWRFRCHPCDKTEDVFGVLALAGNRSPGDVLRDLTPKPATATREAERQPRWFRDIDAICRAADGYEQAYAYRDPATRRADMVVVRFTPGGADKKRFRQYSPGPMGGFVEQAPPKPWPVYNRTRIRDASEVWVVEGEKCVHALDAAGVVATTSPGGAGKAALADWRPLAGKTVFLWPDRDPPDPKTGKRTGIEHMRAVAIELEKLEPPPAVLWIDPDELALADGGDAADYLEPCRGNPAEMGRTIETVKGIAEPMGPGEALDRLIEDTISGKRKAIPFPWPILSNLSRALMPGMVTSVCGDPGCGKSFLLLEACAWWHRGGAKVAIYEMEDDRAYHLNRLLAQLEDNADLIDDVWVRTNPGEAREALALHRVEIDSFSRCITTAPEDTEVTHAELLKWIEGRCIAGCRIIVVDPVTAAASGDKVWIEDRNFIMQAKALARRHGSSLILVTHPKLNAKGGPLNAMAGGAAYPRFSHTVLWVTKHDQAKKVQCVGSAGVFRTSINRSVRIGKARNGPGSGVEIGFIFEGHTLRFSEQGPVQKQLKADEPSPNPFEETEAT